MEAVQKNTVFVITENDFRYELIRQIEEEEKRVSVFGYPEKESDPEIPIRDLILFSKIQAVDTHRLPSMIDKRGPDGIVNILENYLRDPIFITGRKNTEAITAAMRSKISKFISGCLEEIEKEESRIGKNFFKFKAKESLKLKNLKFLHAYAIKKLEVIDSFRTIELSGEELREFVKRENFLVVKTPTFSQASPEDDIEYHFLLAFTKYSNLSDLKVAEQETSSTNQGIPAFSILLLYAAGVIPEDHYKGIRKVLDKNPPYKGIRNYLPATLTEKNLLKFYEEKSGSKVSKLDMVPRIKHLYHYLKKTYPEILDEEQ